MTQLNRLFFNKSLSVEQTVNIIQGKDANETLDKMASVGNAKIFYDALKNEENFITISQGMMILGKFKRKSHLIKISKKRTSRTFVGQQGSY